MNICVFDTETTSLEKPFCYNIGYLIIDEDGNTLASHDFVVEQVWHNPMLFTTAYYADKRSLYISAMRGRTTTMDKFGYICQQMIRDFKAYEVSMAFAYNSSFDERVFNFNCDWFKCNNPFDNITIKDIRGFAHNFLVGDGFKQFCEEHSYFSDSGNYSTTAEVMYRFVSGNTDFIEEHTALSDSIIESKILLACCECGADLNSNYVAFKSIEREVKHHWTVKKGKEELFQFDCKSVTVRKTKHEISIK